MAGITEWGEVGAGGGGGRGGEAEEVCCGGGGVGLLNKGVSREMPKQIEMRVAVVHRRGA